MTMFVHIADEREGASIRRNGLRLPKRGWKQYESDVEPPCCGCSTCQRGKVKSRKLQEAYGRIEDLRAIRAPFEAL